jgi:hypothetical protein
LTPRQRHFALIVLSAFTVCLASSSGKKHPLSSCSPHAKLGDPADQAAVQAALGHLPGTPLRAAQKSTLPMRQTDWLLLCAYSLRELSAAILEYRYWEPSESNFVSTIIPVGG